MPYPLGFAWRRGFSPSLTRRRGVAIVRMGRRCCSVWGSTATSCGRAAAFRGPRLSIVSAASRRGTPCGCILVHLARNAATLRTAHSPLWTHPWVVKCAGYQHDRRPSFQWRARRMSDAYFDVKDGGRQVTHRGVYYCNSRRLGEAGTVASRVGPVLWDPGSLGVQHHTVPVGSEIALNAKALPGHDNSAVRSESVHVKCERLSTRPRWRGEIAPRKRYVASGT